MAEIVPTITVSTPGEYHERLEKILPHTKRIHVDISDGDFAPSELINLAQVYVPKGVELDLHLMVQNPFSHLNSALALKPSLIIVHAEAEGNLVNTIKEIQSFGVDAGVAFLPETQVEDHAELVKLADHVLVFTGDLGHYGGDLDHDQLHKTADARAINPNVETSIDGGVNPDNIDDLDADVLYVGSAYLDMVGE